MALVATACGGSGTPSGSGGVSAARSADAILAQSQAALQTVSSYHVAGMIDPGLSVDMLVVRGDARGTMTARGVTWRVIVHERDVWISGRELWAATLPADRATALGDGWVRVLDTGAAFGFARLLPTLPAAIASIVFGPHPDLAVAGPATFGGRSAIELRGPHDTYDIAAEGPPYPLRWLDSDIPGPDGRPCGIVLDAFDAPATVTPPAETAGVVGPNPSASP